MDKVDAGPVAVRGSDIPPRKEEEAQRREDAEEVQHCLGQIFQEKVRHHSRHGFRDTRMRRQRRPQRHPIQVHPPVGSQDDVEQVLLEGG